jgi:chromosome segregation ATPase
VDALGTQEVLIDERRAYQQQVDWMSNWAEEAVKAYLADGRADPKSAAALKEVWTLREDLRKTNQERSKVQSEADIVRNAAEETRQSLQALKRNTGRQVDDLRQKLAARLLELDKRFADLTQKSTELALRENELRIRFEDQLRDLKIENPLPAPKV